MHYLCNGRDLTLEQYDYSAAL